MRVFNLHPFADRLCPVADRAPLVGSATGQHLRVQIRQVPSLGYRHQVIPAEVARFALDTAFLVAFARGAELRLKLPVRSKRDEPFGLFTPMAPQDLLHRAGQVVIAQQSKYSGKIAEPQFVRLKECLLRRPRIGPMEGATAAHQA